MPRIEAKTQSEANGLICEAAMSAGAAYRLADLIGDEVTSREVDALAVAIKDVAARMEEKLNAVSDFLDGDDAAADQRQGAEKMIAVLEQLERENQYDESMAKESIDEYVARRAKRIAEIAESFGPLPPAHIGALRVLLEWAEFNMTTGEPDLKVWHPSLLETS